MSSCSILACRISLIIASICYFVTAQDSTYAKLAKCVVSDTSGIPEQKVSGLVNLRQERIGDDNTTTITVKLSGFSGTGHHGFHVHQIGDLGHECSDAKGHYNPYNRSHGGPRDVIARHVGDLGNIVANAEGKVDEVITDSQVKLFGDNNVMGRAIVIHEKRDDFNHTSKTGNAGRRLACCIIVDDISSAASAGITFSLLASALFISALVRLL